MCFLISDLPSEQNRISKVQMNHFCVPLLEISTKQQKNAQKCEKLFFIDLVKKLNFKRFNEKKFCAALWNLENIN
jgi:hypothetical protein